MCDYGFVKPDSIGQSHLIAYRENFEEIIFLPTCLKLFGVDAVFGSFLLFDKLRAMWLRTAKFSGPGLCGLDCDLHSG